MTLALVAKEHPALKAVCPPFDFATPPVDPLTFADDLFGLLARKHGLGLAAPQVGLPLRVFAMKVWQYGIVCFNPEILAVSASRALEAEECLSFPGVSLPIVRARNITARWQRHDGTVQMADFEGLAARVFQHELDHLDGKTIEDRVTPVARALAMKRRRRA